MRWSTVPDFSEEFTLTLELVVPIVFVVAFDAANNNNEEWRASGYSSHDGDDGLGRQ